MSVLRRWRSGPNSENIIEMASWSDWFREASRTGYPLDRVIPINLSADIERLYSSGLPVLEKCVIDGRVYTPKKVRDFCDRHPLSWIRVYHRLDRGKRESIIGVNSEAAVRFIEGLGVDLSDFDIQLFEFHHNQYGGNIWNRDDASLVEIAEGTQNIVGRSLAPFFHGFISDTGRVIFRESETKIRIREAAHNALSFLKMSRGEYVKGYFEFIVSDDDRVFFLDYKVGRPFS